MNRAQVIKARVANSRQPGGYFNNSKLIIVATLENNNTEININLSQEAFTEMNINSEQTYLVEDILELGYTTTIKGSDFLTTGIHVALKAMSARILKIR